MRVYNNHMRYTTQLHASHSHRRQHALQYHIYSTAIGLLLFGVVGFILVLVANMASLSIDSIVSGFFASLLRVSVAYVISVILAIAIALIITSNNVIEGILLPIFDVLQSFPSFALFPVLVVALANQPEIIIIGVLVITMIWPILFTIIGAIKNRRTDLEEAATIFGATGPKRLVAFTMPSLLPSIITGSIVGWGEGWEFIVGAELLVNTQVGIGHYLGVLGETHQNSLLALGILILMFLLFVINKAIWLPLLHQSTKYQSES